MATKHGRPVVIRGTILRALQGAALLGLLAACGATATAPVPTPSPLPEPSPTPESSPIPQLSPTPPPFTLETPPIVLEPPDSGSTPTPAPPKVGLPSESLAILEPGPGSQVISPIRVVGYGGPSYQGRVRLRLVGEDGTVLASRVTYLQALPNLAGRFFTELPFSIPHVGEAARLEISTLELRSGLLGHLASVDLVLLSAGLPRVNPALRGAEELAIFAPRDGALVQGGAVAVRGAGWLDTSGPLVVDVLDRNGIVIGSASTPLASPGVGQVGTFAVTVLYQSIDSQWGRIVVHEPAVGIPGTLHYNTIEVVLKP
jgi:hypothetical protein